MNALKPDLMTAAERLDESPRSWPPASASPGPTVKRTICRPGESSLDCAGDQSGHANVLTDGGTA